MGLSTILAEEGVKIKMLNAVNDLIGRSESAEDILLAIKSVEALENVEHLTVFKIITENIVTKINNLNMDSITGEDLTMLSRTLKLRDIGLGSEERWKQLNLDEKNVDFHGDITVGERTLESFDDKVLENFYKN